MCLYTTNKEGLVSDKPVKCYKLYYEGIEDTFIAPFQGKRYKLKEGDEIIAEDPEEIKESPDGGPYGLGRGFIHATTERWMPVFVSGFVRDTLGRLFQPNKDGEYVDEILETVISYLRKCLRLCEMEIPSGERYWIEKKKARRKVAR